MSASNMLPFVTVVMPVYNEACFIRRSLSAVLTQNYPPHRMEILVVDGMSSDDTPTLITEMAAADPRVRLMINPQRIQSSAMNVALDAAQGEIIVRVDGHTVIAPDYVSRCVHYLQTTGADNVGGPVHFVGVTQVGRAIAAAYRSPFSVPSRFTVSQHAEFVDTVYMGAWPRAVFEQIGHFDDTLPINEDYELNYRIRKSGGRIFLSPDIRSEYYGRQTLPALWQQFTRYGSWKFNVLVKHPGSIRPRHLVAPAFVAALILGGLAAPLSRPVRRLWALVLAAYGAANGAASLVQAARDGWSLLPRMPVVFTCIHIAWGIGFWRQVFYRLYPGTQRKENET